MAAPASTIASGVAAPSPCARNVSTGSFHDVWMRASRSWSFVRTRSVILEAERSLLVDGVDVFKQAGPNGDDDVEEGGAFKIGEQGVTHSLSQFLASRSVVGPVKCASAAEAADQRLRQATRQDLEMFLRAVIEHEDRVTAHAKSVASSGMCVRASRRILALFITAIIELLVAFQITKFANTLTEYPLLISFMPVISAVSGNVGLQSSSITTRALSHGFVVCSKWWYQMAREVSAAVWLALASGAFLGIVSVLLFHGSWGFGIVIFIASVASMLTAAVTGTAAPLIFAALNIDPTSMAGPLETAVQDVVGNSCFLLAAAHLLQFFHA